MLFHVHDATRISLVKRKLSKIRIGSIVGLNILGRIRINLIELAVPYTFGSLFSSLYFNQAKHRGHRHFVLWTYYFLFGKLLLSLYILYRLILVNDLFTTKHVYYLLLEIFSWSIFDCRHLARKRTVILCVYISL